MTSSFSCFLDTTRALAAIAVVLNHLRSPIFFGYANLALDQQNPLTRGWFFVTGFGFEAVILFFVLSGFLVGGLGVEKIRNNKFIVGRYVIDRVSRLFVVLVPALFITVFLDLLGSYLFPSSGMWIGTDIVLSKNGYNFSFVSRDTVEIFLCNLAMLQSFYCPVLGSNIPLWTLSYEFWFYAVFGFITLSFYVRGYWRIATLAAVLLVLAFLGPKFLWMLCVWIMGIAAYVINRPQIQFRLLSIATYLVLATISRVLAVGEPRGELTETAIILAQGLAFAWVIMSFKGCNIKLLNRLEKFSGKLASFSYTLYLVHFPIMLFILVAIFEVFDIARPISPLSVTGLTVYFGTFAVLMLSAWAIAGLTEDKTSFIRDGLTAKLAKLKNPGKSANV